MSLIAEAFVRIRPVVDPTFNRQVEQQIKPGLRKVEQSLASSNREVGRFSRGALVGTGALSGLGRAAAFASVSFIGGAGLVAALKSTVAAAEESQKVQAQLANALDAQGISLAANKAAIDRRTQALSQMSGFDDELITTTFINFVRRTGDVTKALNLNAIAVNVARGRNISLEASAALVTRASLGLAGSLRRVGIAARDGASATELLDLLQRKYAGSAVAYGRTAAGAQERFAVALENTQEVIGKALLPAITKALTKATDWLNNSKNQKRIQDDVNRTAQVATTVIGTLARTYDAAAESAGKFAAVLNGIDHIIGGGKPNQNALYQQFLRDVAAMKQVVTVGQQVGKVFAAITGSSPDLTFFESTGAGIPSRVSGGAFLGFPITAAQRRAEALARVSGSGTNAEISAAQAIVDADNRAIAFAQKNIDAGRGNAKNFEDDIIGYLNERGQQLDRIASIADARSAEAKRIRDAQRQALLATIGEGASGGGLAGGAIQRLQALIGQAIGATVGGTTRGRVGAGSLRGFAAAAGNIPTELALREQIAEATFTNEKKLIPFLQAEVTAVKHNLSILQKTGQFKNDQLQATLTIAQLNRRIRDIRNKDKKDSTFSVQDLFTEGANEFARYGSNVAPLSQPLSPQEAGGAVVRGARSMVVTQNFFGERSAAQALQGAAQAARALRYG